MLDETKVVGVYSFNEDVFFILWFYSTNLHCFKIGVYKKEAEKLFTGTNKRDIINEDRVDIENRGKAGKKNGDKANREELVRLSIVARKILAAAEDAIAAKDKGKKNKKEIAKLIGITVVEDLVPAQASSAI